MSAEFEGTLVKWGSSLGLAIPKPIRDGMNLKAGDKVKILLRQNMICFKKVE
jgi:AbrB family looped-hinge helix DNA binding protein